MVLNHLLSDTSSTKSCALTSDFLEGGALSPVAVPDIDASLRVRQRAVMLCYYFWSPADDQVAPGAARCCGQVCQGRVASLMLVYLPASVYTLRLINY